MWVLIPGEEKFSYPVGMYVPTFSFSSFMPSLVSVLEVWIANRISLYFSCWWSETLNSFNALDQETELNMDYILSNSLFEEQSRES